MIDNYLFVCIIKNWNQKWE